MQKKFGGVEKNMYFCDRNHNYKPLKLDTMDIGDRIPDVLGFDQNGKEIKSSDFAGRKLILYSYPKANTSGCTAEACSLQSHKQELEAAGYSIVGVSKDKIELQKKFADTQGLDFPLIADTDTTLHFFNSWDAGARRLLAAERQ